jgi:hypothetical protein
MGATTGGTTWGGGMGVELGTGTVGGVVHVKTSEVVTCPVRAPSAKVAVMDCTPLKLRGRQVKRMPVAMVSWTLQTEQVTTPGAQIVRPPEVNGQLAEGVVVLNKAWKGVPHVLGVPGTKASCTLEMRQVEGRGVGGTVCGGGTGVGGTVCGGGTGVEMGAGATGAGVVQVKMPVVEIVPTRGPNA